MTGLELEERFSEFSKRTKYIGRGDSMLKLLLFRYIDNKHSNYGNILDRHR